MPKRYVVISLEDFIVSRKFEDYTESEFLTLLNDICFVNSPDEQSHNVLIDQFVAASEHPRSYDVIYYPLPDEDDSPEGILKTVKEWRAANGKPGFKQ